MALGPAPTARFSQAQIRAARGLLGWSVNRLAADANIEPRALRLYENGRSELSERELGQLAKALRGAGIVAIPPARAGEGVRLIQPADRRRAPLAIHGRPELPSWLPLVDGHDG